MRYEDIKQYEIERLIKWDYSPLTIGYRCKIEYKEQRYFVYFLENYEVYRVALDYMFFNGDIYKTLDYDYNYTLEDYSQQTLRLIKENLKGIKRYHVEKLNEIQRDYDFRSNKCKREIEMLEGIEHD